MSQSSRDYLLKNAHEYLHHLHEVVLKNPHNCVALMEILRVSTLDADSAGEMLRELDDATLFIVAAFADFAMGLTLTTMPNPQSEKKQ